MDAIDIWTWEKVSESEYRIRDNNGTEIASLSHKYYEDSDNWFCKFCNRIPGDSPMYFSITIIGVKTEEEAMRAATEWIYYTCDYIADSFHSIRDKLPTV